MNESRIQRRTVLRVSFGAGLATLAGCLGDDDDVPPPEGDSPADSTDDPDEPDDAPDQQITISDDFDSYVVESEVVQEPPDDDVLIIEELLRRDFVNERSHSRSEMGRPGEDGLVMEYYHTGEGAYQIMPDGTCTEMDHDVIAFQDGQIGDIQIPTEEDIDQAENVEYQGEHDVDGVLTDVWVFDLSETIEFNDGEMRIYIATDTNYVLRVAGWYPVGPADNPTEISYEQRYHSFNEELDISLPDTCEA